MVTLRRLTADLSDHWQAEFDREALLSWDCKKMALNSKAVSQYLLVVLAF